MKLFAVMSHKGGVGKTTSAVFLAEELAAKGYRTLLVDADRQQGAGLLLEVGTPTGDVQPTRVPGLSYLGSAKFTDQEVAARSAAAAGQFDIGVVDTPSLDDSLAQAWLQQAHATLMIMQVEPLTVKTFPSALATLESVRRLNPKIEIVGLLPTMFDPSLETHRTCLTELLTRKPEAVFTPVVPADSGLMHRAAGAGAPEIGPAARQAYQVAADRIIRVLNPTGSGAPTHAFDAGGHPASVPRFASGGYPATGPSSAGGPPAAPAWEMQQPQASPGYSAPAAWQGTPAAASPQGGHGGSPLQAPGFQSAGAFSAPASPYAAPASAAAEAWGAPVAPPAQAAPTPWPVAPAPQPQQAPMAYPSQPAPAFDQSAFAGSASGPYGMSQSVTSDEQAPDWWQGSEEQEISTGRRGRVPSAERRAQKGENGGRRSGAPRAAWSGDRGRARPAWAPFALGFAAACILLLLAWVGGVFRKLPVRSPKPAVSPAHAAPSAKKAAAVGHAVVGEPEIGDENEPERRSAEERRGAAGKDGSGKE